MFKTDAGNTCSGIEGVQKKIETKNHRRIADRDGYVNLIFGVYMYAIIHTCQLKLFLQPE